MEPTPLRCAARFGRLGACEAATDDMDGLHGPGGHGNVPQVNRWARAASGTPHMSDLLRWEARFGAAGYLFGTEPNAFLARTGRPPAPR